MVAVLVPATLGLVVLPWAGPAGTAGVSALAVAGTVWALLRSSARVRVGGGELRAGRARIPTSLLGRVAMVDARRMAELRGPRADARAYLCQRPWIGGGVLIEIEDPDDPVPYWLVSSRTPQRLAAALREARGEPPTAPGQEHSRQTG